ncbi:kelch domain-containing protein [Anaeramoeba ignava]|uniref:Kelch domain-containing protein n=1 Tax=Anaeramoeba ignava TaxID=1746090 RepID=A0A9Q0LIV7_ANAIG|nr:kelch domain-containing protein [Anaeramoeba ignava]
MNDLFYEKISVPKKNRMDTFKVGKWVELHPKNEVVQVAKAGFTCIQHQDKIYLYGGKNYQNETLNPDIYSFCLRTYEWEKINTNGKQPEDRCGHSMCAIHNNIYVWGGYDEITWFQEVYIFDTQNDNWSKSQSTSSSLPEGRYSFSMIPYKKKFYIFGGVPSNQRRFNDLWSFDIESNEWEEIKPKGKIPFARSSHSSLLHNDKMYIFGGLGKNIIRRNDLWYFDFFNNYWVEIQQNETVPNLPVGSGILAEIFHDRYFVLFSGYNSKKTWSNSNYVLDLETKEWRKLQSKTKKPPKRYGASCARYFDKWIVFGGQVNNSESLQDIHFFIFEEDLAKDLHNFLRMEELIDI